MEGKEKGKDGQQEAAPDVLESFCKLLARADIPFTMREIPPEDIARAKAQKKWDEVVIEFETTIDD